MSVACQVNWASNFVVGIGWPYMHEAMGPYSFVTFGALLVLTFLFTWMYLPETANRTVAEVLKAANTPKRACGGCLGGGDVAEEASINDRGEGMRFIVVEGVDINGP